MGKTEEWRPVVGYEDFYEVSNLGRVKSVGYGIDRILKPSPNGKGYLQVKLYKNGEKSMHLVHILIMRAFVGKCPDGYEVDHYDWNPRNNKLDNLSYQPKEANRARKSPQWLQNVSEANKKKAQDTEWRKNQAEAMKKLAQDPEWLRKNVEKNKKLSQDPEWQKKHAEGTRKACCKLVDQYTLDGTFVKTWESATDAAMELGLSKGNISKCCNGRGKSAGGFIWRMTQ